MMLWLRGTILALALLPSACGYHPVGGGQQTGAIPADVQTLSLVGNADVKLQSMLRSRLPSDRYQWRDSAQVEDMAHHALLFVQLSPPKFTPSAYDAAGIATQYRMIYAGQLLLEQDGKTLWKSGPVQRQGDVYVSAGPASVEASRTRLLHDLQKQWLSDVVGRLRSGF
ncbi:MAG: adenosylmethionine-8-amino-7-oxononanoate aminotransferase [Mariprofundus sp.]